MRSAHLASLERDCFVCRVSGAALASHVDEEVTYVAAQPTLDRLGVWGSSFHGARVVVEPVTAMIQEQDVGRSVRPFAGQDTELPRRVRVREPCAVSLTVGGTHPFDAEGARTESQVDLERSAGHLDVPATARGDPFFRQHLANDGKGPFFGEGAGSGDDDVSVHGGSTAASGEQQQPEPPGHVGTLWIHEPPPRLVRPEAHATVTAFG